MDLIEAFTALGIGLGLGLLVGLQRERAHSQIAGVRTFPLITVFGVLSGMLSDRTGPWVIPAGLIALAIATAIGNLMRPRTEESPGITTEVAVVLMYVVGAATWLMPDHRAIPVAIGVACALLLHFKAGLHGLVHRFSDRDLRSIMQFALVTFIVLPILPDRTFGPYDVLNPRQIWWMVVLVVGIGLGAYLVSKFLPARLGMVVEGLLGGLISSTATTVTAARAARGNEHAPVAAVVIALAWSVMFIRVIVEIAVVAPGFVSALAPPLVIMFGAAVTGAMLMWLRATRGESGSHPPGNPTELSTALKFAVIYAAVLWLTAAAQHRFGAPGMNIVAAISGLTDMDAITLSAARLASQDRLSPSAAGQAIVIAAISNVVFKSVIVFALGGRQLAWRLAPASALPIIAGAVLLAVWRW